ncbi:pyridoxamine 5'-phosphate oxidase [Clostridia bacterium]|nr:pyridoxamine 5'-phosphate oxidase [Clostridia bacterium]
MSAEKEIQGVYDFLKSNGTFYLATIDGDQARVRPFGAQAIVGGKLYFVTNNQKAVYAQLKANPKFEVSTTNAETFDWLRFTGEAVFDDSVDVKRDILAQNERLNGMYSAEDEKFAVFYAVNVKGAYESMTGGKREFTF